MKKLLLLVLLVMNTGCATIVNGGPDHIQVTSNPSGARVYLNNQVVGTTPMQLTVRRHDDGDIRIEMNGYEPYITTRDKIVNGWIFGNLLLGGVIGVGVDLITSNQGVRNTEPVYVQLSPKSTRELSSEK